MTASASDPSLWVDNAGETPPVAWEFLDTDDRWWFTNGLPGVIASSNYWIEITASSFPELIEMIASMTEAPSNPLRTLTLSYTVTGEDFSASGDLLTTGEVGEYPVQIDTSEWPSGVELTLRLTVTNPFDWNTYGGVIAMLGPSGIGACEINCACEEESDNATLAEYRHRMLVRAGFAAVASSPPPGTAELFNTFLQDAQDVLYRKYPALETRRFFHWDLVQGQRFYGLRDDTKEGCLVNLEPYKNIEGAWLIDLNGAWLPVAEGIPPVWYTTVNEPGLPVRYEIRQCIEIFPAPPADGYQLVIKGHFGKRPFTAEDSKPTMNGELVYLFALANALDYYNKPSAKSIAAQAQDLLGQLVAGTHGSRRYVPGKQDLPPVVMPIYTPWPGEY